MMRKTMIWYAVAGIVFALIALGCRQMAGGSTGDDGSPAEDSFKDQRLAMVAKQLARRDITDERVLAAMRKVPRHEFVPADLREGAYRDHPLPIGYGQTISQPYIVAYMTQAIKPKPEYKVLEIGTGSGYQAAVLAEVVGEVYSIEIVEALGKRAAATLEKLGYDNVQVKVGDGYAGWDEHGPYDAIMLTAAPPEVPKPLFDQLKQGGFLVAPIGVHSQDLVLYTRTADGIAKTDLFSVRFVPMTGKAQQ